MIYASTIVQQFKSVEQCHTLHMPNNPASVIILSRRQKTSVPKAAMMETFGVEEPQYAPGTPLAWDTDADYQLLQALSFSADSQQERESTNFIIVVEAYDQVEAYQLSQLPFMLNMDLLDTGVEHIIVPEAYDTDAFQQLPMPLWNLDYEEEREGVPYIIVSPGIVRGWDTDIGNMVPWLGWVEDYEDVDLYQYIKPLTVIVPILYKLSSAKAMEAESVTAFTATQLYEFSTAQSQELESLTVYPSMELYELTASKRMKMGSFTVDVWRVNYELSTKNAMDVGSYTSFPATQLYEMKAQRSMVGQFTAQQSMQLYQLTAQQSMIMSSFTAHGAS